MRYLEVIYMPPYRALLAIDDFVGNTEVVGVDFESLLLKLCREVLPEK